MKRKLTLREEFEKREDGFLSPHGCRSARSTGRPRPESPCPIRTAFQKDRDRIVYCNAFRRLKHKTQVFLSPLGDHYRTRLTHTLEVAEIARTIARAMRLNEDLAEAIALGHDLGHTPFGHGGEMVLKELYSEAFTHNEQSLRVVDVLERRGSGLNLTHEVRNGIIKHSKGFGDILITDPDTMPTTMEGRIVRIADLMAYLNHDLDDAIRSGVISPDQIPPQCVKVLGDSHSRRNATMIQDVVFNSEAGEDGMSLKISDEVHEAMLDLRTFLYNNVYRSPRVHREFVKAKKILSELYYYLLENEDEFRLCTAEMELAATPEESIPDERSVCDLIASMTDRYALSRYEKLFFPTPLF
ncbi:MAG: deoxyguanosinetriphosphate triphosphohydrolase [Desulfatibacillaceae bacterium]